MRVSLKEVRRAVDILKGRIEFTTSEHVALGVSGPVSREFTAQEMDRRISTERIDARVLLEGNAVDIIDVLLQDNVRLASALRTEHAL